MVVLASSTKSSPGDHRAGTKADRFVEASPLTVAAVCRDGIAILATHAAAAHDPLLLENISASQSEEGEAPRDLPRSSRGPFRIGALDAAGSVLVSAGWRTDCAALASQCRSLAASEMSRYGDGSHGTMEYGRYLAEGASTWMAHCAFSDNVRALSSVGLLGSCGSGGSSYLWLVDSTGAYRTRAHAIGKGASRLNERLVGIDFLKCSKEEGVQTLLDIVTDEFSLLKEDKANHPSHSHHVELAVVDPVQSTMKRLRQPILTPLLATSPSESSTE
eukprot:CAMPEP_0198290258 /NCGR_PEP_ID=MMETSP1449-20131203/8207_1 /TAXON_ID=420275 /ORGANISM="Attheya septentrionalis, Strain CCMP2084" /LENGTH=274 /DNA_ID=CAMNT_0043988747 /DNA_START=117 /DNA_END=941 /DNA_ORIENTATION=-